MNNQKNIIVDFWEYVESQNTVRGKKIYKWLDYDLLGGIIVDNDVFWIELKTKHSVIPEYVFKYIRAWCKNQGYTYLYDKYQRK